MPYHHKLGLINLYCERSQQAIYVVSFFVCIYLSYDLMLATNSFGKFWTEFIDCVKHSDSNL